METTLTVRLSKREAAELAKLASHSGKSRSDVVREALRRHFVQAKLDVIRASLVPRARTIGWLTEEDVFREVS
ncbi:MAG: ribbon-helix-helix protein, CopG family [Acidobacteria bacterium]|nr:ribbon-helix-helix protein, CopG family [Acidobacteriota bacterium]